MDSGETNELEIRERRSSIRAEKTHPFRSSVPTPERVGVADGGEEGWVRTTKARVVDQSAPINPACFTIRYAPLNGNKNARKANSFGRFCARNSSDRPESLVRPLATTCRESKQLDPAHVSWNFFFFIDLFIDLHRKLRSFVIHVASTS